MFYESLLFGRVGMGFREEGVSGGCGVYKHTAWNGGAGMWTVTLGSMQPAAGELTKSHGP